VTGQALFPILLFVLFGAAIIAVAIFAWQIERKRRDALMAVAARLGLSFSAGKDRGLARQYEDFRGLHEGENRYVFDVLAGTHSGRRLTAFDFHYETTSQDSEGRSSTTHYHRHVVLLNMERDFPNLFVAPEGLISKIAQAIGYDDIDFESHEFSRRFCVRSTDKKYAYDFCNARMIDFLLNHSGLDLETRGAILATVFKGKMSPSVIESELAIACAVRAHMPDYLFAAP
jgi:hypothetical protein